MLRKSPKVLRPNVISDVACFKTLIKRNLCFDGKKYFLILFDYSTKLN